MPTSRSCGLPSCCTRLLGRQVCRRAAVRQVHRTPGLVKTHLQAPPKQDSTLASARAPAEVYVQHAIRPWHVRHVLETLFVRIRAHQTAAAAG